MLVVVVSWPGGKSWVKAMIYRIHVIATSNDPTPKGGLVREIPYFREIWVGEIL